MARSTHPRPGKKPAQPYHHGDLRRALLDEALLSNARLNATGAVLCRIKCDSPCHIICDWAQFQAEIRTLGEARQCGEARSRFCQISMPWWVLLLVEAETRHKLGDFSQSQIIWQPQ